MHGRGKYTRMNLMEYGESVYVFGKVLGARLEATLRTSSVKREHDGL